MSNSCNLLDDHETDPSMDSTISSLPIEWWGNHPLYQWQGFWFRRPYLQATTNVVKEFKPLPNDVILASFPKTGTTWLKAILFSIINPTSRRSLLTNHPHELVPSLELQIYSKKNPIPTSQNLLSPRLFSTHIPYELLPESVRDSGCRIVYVGRNPRDTFVSWWHFINKTELLEPLPLEEAFDKFCSGFVTYGPFFEHVLGYWKASLERPKQVCFVTYEDLKSDPKCNVKKLAEFLECSFSREEEEVEEIVSGCSFEKLSNLEVNKNTELAPWMKLSYNSFFRRGVVGDYHNFLTPQMLERLEQVTEEKMKGSGLHFGP